MNNEQTCFETGFRNHAKLGKGYKKMWSLKSYSKDLNMKIWAVHSQVWECVCVCVW